MIRTNLEEEEVEEERFISNNNYFFSHKSNKFISLNFILNWKRGKQKVLTYVSLSLYIFSI